MFRSLAGQQVSARLAKATPVSHDDATMDDGRLFADSAKSSMSTVYRRQSAAFTARPQQAATAPAPHGVRRESNRVVHSSIQRDSAQDQAKPECGDELNCGPGAWEGAACVRRASQGQIAAAAAPTALRPDEPNSQARPLDNRQNDQLARVRRVARRRGVSGDRRR